MSSFDPEDGIPDYIVDQEIDRMRDERFERELEERDKRATKYEHFTIRELEALHAGLKAIDLEIGMDDVDADLEAEIYAEIGRRRVMA